MIRPVVLPPPVHPGDRVGVAALSGPVDPGRLEAGLEALEALGYRPVPAKNLRRRHGLFAGSDDERLDAFHELVADDSLGAIVFARGGWGVNRLLDRLDWSLLARRPRAYVGYSDLTPFLLQVVERLGLVAFHGPMVAADLARGLDDAEIASFTGALAGRACEPLPVRVERGTETAEGPLLGGCLSLLVSLLGTPWAVDLEGALLFVEDLNEPPYRIDRMLTHLRLSGTLARIHGLVVGHLRGPDQPPLAAGEIALEAVIREAVQDDTFSFATSLPAGHVPPNRTLWLGAWARFDPSASLVDYAPFP